MPPYNSVSLKWNEYQNVAVNAFSGIFNNNQRFTDVTLASEDGELVKAHKIILSSSSAVFEKMLSVNTDKHLLLYLRGCTMSDLEYLLHFIYLGEVEDERFHVERFLQITRDFEIRGVQNCVKEAHQISSVTHDKQPEKSSYHASFIKKEIDEIDIGMEKILAFQDADFKISPYEGKRQSVTASICNLDLDQSVKLEQSDLRINNVTSIARKRKLSMNKEEEAYNGNETRKKSHNMSKIHDCEVCGKQLASYGSLFNHRKTFHEGITYPCDFCGYKAGQAARLKIHKQKYHSNDGSYFKAAGSVKPNQF